MNVLKINIETLVVHSTNYQLWILQLLAQIRQHIHILHGIWILRKGEAETIEGVCDQMMTFEIFHMGGMILEHSTTSDRIVDQGRDQLRDLFGQIGSFM